MFNTILVATDLLDACDAHVHTAINLAKKYQSKLIILHLCESATHGKYRHYIKHFQTGEDIVTDSSYEETIKGTIREVCGDALGDNVDYEIIVKPGFPWEEILRCARKNRVDLVVLGPHTNRAEEMGVVRVTGPLDSTADGVIMHERYPVIISNQYVPENRLDFKKIMVCIDFAESCKLACRVAIKMAHENRAKLYIFHMLPTTFISDELRQKAENIEEEFEKLSSAIPEPVEYEHVVREGTVPYLEILKFSTEEDIHLIAMGSHLREKGKRWYDRSAVQQVSARAACPVMIVSTKRALQQMLK